MHRLKSGTKKSDISFVTEQPSYVKNVYEPSVKVTVSQADIDFSSDLDSFDTPYGPTGTEDQEPLSNYKTDTLTEQVRQMAANSGAGDIAAGNRDNSF